MEIKRDALRPGRADLTQWYILIMSYQVSYIKKPYEQSLLELLFDQIWLRLLITIEVGVLTFQILGYKIS
jgi:hypothetical protein